MLYIHSVRSSTRPTGAMTMRESVNLKEALAFPAPPDMIGRFCAKHRGVPRPLAERVFRELMKYLALLAHLQMLDASTRCSPPVDIDAMWHHFIADDTVLYTECCDRFLGGYVHHRAGEVYSNALIGELASKFEIKLDPEIWDSDNVDCG